MLSPTLIKIIEIKPALLCVISLTSYRIEATTKHNFLKQHQQQQRKKMS